jgi:16S rRNA (uracil1498-N3)-methyltransferase
MPGMNSGKESLILDSVFLSDIELYYSPTPVVENIITIGGDECHHIANVMRHACGDKIFVTDGKGSIYRTTIQSVSKKNVTAAIEHTYKYENRFHNICFCIPRLKNADRFEFALEKCVELGITNFIVFDSKRTVAKGDKSDRWQKILTSAMKQSLRSWLPYVSYAKSVDNILEMDGTKIFLDQNAEINILKYLASNGSLLNTKTLFLFGPEGGFCEDDFETQSAEYKVKLTENRLRSETAIIMAGSLLVNFIVNEIPSEV